MNKILRNEEAKRIGIRLIVLDGSNNTAVIKFPKLNEILAEDFIRKNGAKITVTNGGFNSPEKLFEIAW